MAKMPKAKLRIALPKGSELRGQGDTVIQFTNSTHETILAKEIADAMRAKGYKCKVFIEREISEEY